MSPSYELADAHDGTGVFIMTRTGERIDFLYGGWWGISRYQFSSSSRYLMFNGYHLGSREYRTHVYDLQQREMIVEGVLGSASGFSSNETHILVARDGMAMLVPLGEEVDVNDWLEY